MILTFSQSGEISPNLVTLVMKCLRLSGTDCLIGDWTCLQSGDANGKIYCRTFFVCCENAKIIICWKKVTHKLF